MAVTALSSVDTAGTLNAPGVGSGLDVQGMVGKLMAVEQRPLTQLSAQEATFHARLSTLGSINGALSSLQSAAQALASASAVTFSATASDTSVLTASAAGDALPGYHSVTVNKLAQQQKLLSAGKDSATSSVGSGASTTLTFTFGTISSVLGPDSDGYYSDAVFAANAARTPVSVIIGSTNNTLAGIRDAINAASAGVTASIVNDGGAQPYRLSITSNDTGLANSLKIATSGDAAIGSLLGYDPQTVPPQNLRQMQAARNADLSVDGITIASTSNSVAGAIQGVTLNLAKETSANITVQRDTSSITSSLSALVRAYNSANLAIAGATAKGALLQGDSGVLGMQRQMVNILGSARYGGSVYTRLSDLGVSLQKDGSLAFNSSKASAALSADPASVAALTAAVGKAIDSAATAMIGASGPISAKTDGINRSIKDIGTRRTQMQAHLDAVQTRYRKQFSALDTLISKMNQTSSYLTQQLDAIANLNKQK